MEDGVERGPMRLDAKFIQEAYGGEYSGQPLEMYHGAVTDALRALCEVDQSVFGDDEREEIRAVIGNHISVLHGILLLTLEDMDKAPVLQAVKREKDDE